MEWTMLSKFIPPDFMFFVHLNLKTEWMLACAILWHHECIWAVYFDRSLCISQYLEQFTQIRRNKWTQTEISIQAPTLLCRSLTILKKAAYALCLPLKLYTHLFKKTEANTLENAFCAVSKVAISQLVIRENLKNMEGLIKPKRIYHRWCTHEASNYKYLPQHL